MQREVPTIAAASPVVNASGQFGFSAIRVSLCASRNKRERSRKSEVGRWKQGASLPMATPIGLARHCAGQDGADKLFAGFDPIGESIRVRNLPFRVVGVLAAKGSVYGWSRSGRHCRQSPLHDAQRKLLAQHILSINQARSRRSASRHRSYTESKLRTTETAPKIVPGDSDDFLVPQFRPMQPQTVRAVDDHHGLLLLGAFAGEFRCSSGIGNPMNIMLGPRNGTDGEIGIPHGCGRLGPIT